MNPHSTTPQPGAKALIGTLSVSRKGLGFIVPHDADGNAPKRRGKRSDTKDAKVDERDLNCGFHGDIVEYRLIPSRPGEIRAAVTHVLSRASDRFVGTLKAEGNSLFFTADDARVYKDFIVEGDLPEGAKDGMKAYVLMRAWSDPKSIPRCEILRVIGEKGQHETEMRSILMAKGFVLDYPQDVEAQAEETAATAFPIPEDEIARRIDMRGTLTFTIDPEDAKDFDDAISFKDLGDGRYEIGVHIADVSHYVRPGTPLDREAADRAFSVYLVDRTVPMLPHQLSTHVCSLNPHENRCAFSAIFIMNDAGEVLERRFGKSIIYSDMRFTYENAQDVLDDKCEDKNVCDQFEFPLKKINAISKELYRKNKEAGAIDFDTTEVKFVLDENFHPIAVKQKPRLDTNRLIEQYMLLANREVAQYIFTESKKRNGDAGLMYRVHDSPDADRIADLTLLIRALGHQLPVGTDGKPTGKDINALLQRIQGKAEEGLLKVATIRSMSKAVYSPNNAGHFGLAFAHYTHFTSPIRRYPDLVVHRVLQAYLTGTGPSKAEISSFDRVAQHSTFREIQAAEAERDSVRFKQCEYWQERVGQEINGVISGVTEWGLYVEDEVTKAEGMVRLRDLGDDFFELREKQYTVVGARSGMKYALGDKVRAKVTAVDVEGKSIDLAMLGKRE